MDKNHGFN